MNHFLKKVYSTLIPSKTLKYAYLKSSPKAILINELQLIYLPIPKVANRSIKEVLADKTEKSGKLSAHKYDWDYISLKKTFESSYYSFAFVRNPLDRLVSCYMQKSSKRKLTMNFWKYGNAIWEGMSFEDFANFVCDTPDSLADRHFKSQHHFLYQNNRLNVDFLGKFENLVNDWEQVASRFELRQLNHSNKSEHKDWKHYYNKKLANKVANRYQKDIALFEYSEIVGSIIERLK